MEVWVEVQGGVRYKEGRFEGWRCEGVSVRGGDVEGGDGGWINWVNSVESCFM